MQRRQAKAQLARERDSRLIDVRSGTLGSKETYPPGASDVALLNILMDKLQLARARNGFPQPAYERFARQAPRYRRWGMETRHALGDAYPLYTLTTLRNLAEALFDWSTGFEDAPVRARLLRPCTILFTSSVAQFASHVDPHIGEPTPLSA